MIVFTMLQIRYYDSEVKDEPSLPHQGMVCAVAVRVIWQEDNVIEGCPGSSGFIHRPNLHNPNF